MNDLIRPLQNSKGYALVTVLMAMVVIGLLIATTVFVATRDTRLSQAKVIQSRAIDAAEAGIENAIAVMRITSTQNGNNAGTDPYFLAPLPGTACAGGGGGGGGGGVVSTQMTSFGQNLLSGAPFAFYGYGHDGNNDLIAQYNNRYGTNLTAAALDSTTNPPTSGDTDNYSPSLENTAAADSLVVVESLGNNSARIRSFARDSGGKSSKGVEAVVQGNARLPAGALAQLGMDNVTDTGNTYNTAYNNNMTFKWGNNRRITVSLGPLSAANGFPTPIVAGGQINTNNLNGVDDDNFTNSGVDFRIQNAAGQQVAMTNANVPGINAVSIFRGRQTIDCNLINSGRATANDRNSIYATLLDLQSQLFSLFPYDGFRVLALNDPEPITWVVGNVTIFGDGQTNTTTTSRNVVFTNDTAFNGINGSNNSYATVQSALNSVGITQTDLTNAGISTATSFVVRRWEGKNFPYDVLFHATYGFFAAHNTDPLAVNGPAPARIVRSSGQTSSAGYGSGIDRRTQANSGVPLAGIIYVSLNPVDMEYDPNGNFWWTKRNGGTNVELFNTNMPSDLYNSNPSSGNPASFPDPQVPPTTAAGARMDSHMRGTWLVDFDEIGFARYMQIKNWGSVQMQSAGGPAAPVVSFNTVQPLITFDNAVAAGGVLNKFGLVRHYKHIRPPAVGAVAGNGVVGTAAVINAWNAMTSSVDTHRFVWVQGNIFINRYLNSGAGFSTGAISGYGFNGQDSHFQGGPIANDFQSLQANEYPYNAGQQAYDLNADGVIDNTAINPPMTVSEIVKNYVTQQFGVGPNATHPEVFQLTAPANIPSVLYDVSIVDMHGTMNWSGLAYTPSRFELESELNAPPAGTQIIQGIQYYQIYFGSLVSGAGSYVEARTGNTFISYDNNTIKSLNLQSYTNLSIISHQENQGL